MACCTEPPLPNPECGELIDAWAVACPSCSWVECAACGQWFKLTPFGDLPVLRLEVARRVA